MTLKWWKTEMRYYPSRYLLLIVGFYQRSVLLFLYGFHFNFYFKNVPIRNMVYWCSGAGGGRSTGYMPYTSSKDIIKTNSWCCLRIDYIGFISSIVLYPLLWPFAFFHGRWWPIVCPRYGALCNVQKCFIHGSVHILMPALTNTQGYPYFMWYN